MFKDFLQSRIGLQGEQEKTNQLQCNVKLPDAKPLCNINAEVQARYFNSVYIFCIT